MKNEVIIFSDGAAKGNPGKGGWAAIIVENGKEKNKGACPNLLQGRVKELGGFEKNTTNNRMELTAVIKALAEVARQPATLTSAEIQIYTDSKYLINGITNWVYNWQKNGWKTKKLIKGKKGEFEDVLNKDLWEELLKLVTSPAFVKNFGEAKWNYVGGHIGIVGNERCDEIASGLALGEKVPLYSGALSDYGLDVLNLKDNRPGHQNVHPALTKAGKGKAYSYVSLINGVIHKDKTWAECEKRVKGKSGVKYKKSISLEDEKTILKSWGINV